MTESFIETRCARLRKNVQENFVSVEYVAHKKKVRPNPENENGNTIFGPNKSLKNEENPEGNRDPKKEQELAMKRARHEVIKFGMSGLGNVEARKAKLASIMALGARPPKNRRSNYKKLKEDRERIKQIAIKKEQRVSGADHSLVKRKPKRQRKEKDSGLLGIYGKVQKGTGKR